MPDEPYPVVSVPTRTDVPESRGTRTKFWITFPGDEHPWLLKIPRTDTGEHWAEKVAAEIGSLIGVDCAQVELARWVQHAVFGQGLDQRAERLPRQRAQPELLATICKSFLPDAYAENTDIAFLQGWEVLQYFIEDYDTHRRFGQRGHNIKNIAGAFAQLLSWK